MGDERFCELLHTFVKFSRVLSHAVLHFGKDVEGPDDNVGFSDGDAGSSVLLNNLKLTFFR